MSCLAPPSKKHCINQDQWELMTALEKGKAKDNRPILFCNILRWMAVPVDQKRSVKNLLFTIPDSECLLLFARMHSFHLQNSSCSGSCTNWLDQKPLIQICCYWKPATKLAFLHRALWSPLTEYPMSIFLKYITWEKLFC